MQVVVMGVDHERTPLSVREKLAISREELPRALVTLRSLPGVQEAVILSTCNRTELYVAADPGFAADSLCEVFRSFHGLSPDELRGAEFCTCTDTAAARHLCEVAAGLASAVLGETQILAQVKEAYQVASAAGTVGPYLHQMFSLAIATAKQVQTDTAIGVSCLSMGSVAMQMIRKTFSQADRLQVLIVGTGKMGRLVLRHVSGAGVAGITLASRDLLRASAMAEKTGAHCVPIHDVPGLLSQVDVVITATTGLVLYFASVQGVLEHRQEPLLVIDLGVPRNVQPTVSEIPPVRLLNVDNLKEVAAANLGNRRKAIQKARAIVERSAGRYADWMATRRVVPLISLLTEAAERIRRQELDRTLSRLGSSEPHQQVAVEELTRSLVGKLLHECTVTLKRSATGR